MVSSLNFHLKNQSVGSSLLRSLSLLQSSFTRRSRQFSHGLFLLVSWIRAVVKLKKIDINLSLPFDHLHCKWENRQSSVLVYFCSLVDETERAWQIPTRS